MSSSRHFFEGAEGIMSCGLIERSTEVKPPRRVEGDAPLRLLVVDDSAFEHQVIAKLLRETKGLTIQTAANGAEGLSAVEADPPDAILTDLVMPDMDGLELVRQVRERHPAIPIILMTAFGNEDVAMRALRAGAANYIPKKDLKTDLPIVARQLVDVFSANRRRAALSKCLSRRDSLFEVGNDPNLVDSLIELLHEELAGMGVADPPALIRIRVALQEALVNALYHGNLEVDSELRQEDERRFFNLANLRRSQSPYRSRLMRIRARIDRQSATFTISDEGPGFDTTLVDRPLNPEDLLRVGGRGLLLIRTFMDEVRFNERGNSITMTKRFEGA